MTEQEQIAVLYHSIFHYQLSKSELDAWRSGPRLKLTNFKKFRNFPNNKTSNGENSSINNTKRSIAEQAALVLEKIPTILFVGISGSLAMNNAKVGSDIDLLIITKKDTLWMTRIWAAGVLFFENFKLRTAQNKNEKDRLCMNLWIDESALDLPGMPHNAYTAHEILQVVPLVNKRQVYEQWIKENAWIYGYWPHVVSKKTGIRARDVSIFGLSSVLNLLCYFVQRFYMQRKITRERITLHYAYFHPFDWAKKVMNELKQKHIEEIPA